MKKLFFILGLFFSTLAFGADFTKTVKPSGGDYTSLEACMNANEQDLTGVGIMTVEIDGTWSSADTTAVTIHNYTTDATHYINIYTTSAARHQGVYSASYYRLYPNTTTIVIDISEDYVTINGLQFRGYWNGYTIMQIRNNNNTIKNNIFYDNDNGQGIYLSDGTANTYIYNNLFYDILDSALYCSWNTGITSAYIYNNTFYGCTNGIVNGKSGSTAPLLKNNLCNGNGTDYSGTFSASSVNNISEDTTSPNEAYRSKAVTFENEAGDNFHLSSSDTNAKDAGVDLSGVFTTDIDGQTRSGTWDIGADEYVAAAGAIIKTINGLAIGSVKTYNGLAIGSVKTINGAAAQ